MITAHQQSQTPHSMAGQFLKALWLNQSELRDSIRENAARTGSWNLDAIAVDHAAFVLAVRQRFSDDVDVRSVTSWVAAARDRFALDDLSLLDGEAMVRAALEEEVSTEDIEENSLEMWRLIVSTEIAQELDPSEVDRILVAAERLATEEGYFPSAADDQPAIYPPGSPVTVVGRWVRARALGMPPTPSDPAKELSERINGRDGRHVFDALLEMSVRRRFSDRRDDAEIKQFASRVAERDGMDEISATAVEALTRSRLGVPASLRGISLLPAVKIAMSSFFQTVADLDLSESQIDGLVHAAEQLAMKRGHRPLLAI